jgi:hypothetical protein
LNNPALFTPEKRCILPSGLKNQQGQLDPYESDFYLYLDLEAGMPESQTSGNATIDVCYSRPSGFCPQRTAWISHLLANDLYQEALLQEDPTLRTDLFNRALQMAQRAEALYHDKHGNPGFAQCIFTSALIRSIQDKLQSVSK